MNRRLLASSLGLLVFFIASSVPGQTVAPPASDGQPPAPSPGSRHPTGDVEGRAKQLDDQIDGAMRADRWPEAVAKADELSTLRTRAEGAKHFEAVTAAWRAKTLRRVAALPEEDRAAYLAANDSMKQAGSLVEKGKYAEARPLLMTLDSQNR
jgi:hypothetical protein